ncbi:MAG: sigma-70 family RNA polymerase sigma factor [Myxococcaceae bacterium]|nr:sigma-70 family RNA polymerase sigma factor [Myxococcaceae bacterium]
MTDSTLPGHVKSMALALHIEHSAEFVSEPKRAEALRLDFAQIYENQVDFVWRNLSRLGVPTANVDDATQDVFLVVHRRLSAFCPGSSLKAWLAAIAVRVAHDYRRGLQRKGQLEELSEDLADTQRTPVESAALSEGKELIDRVLDTLDAEKREVFVLAELEEMTAPEISEALGVRLNTVYSRLRVARELFNAAVERLVAEGER